MPLAPAAPRDWHLRTSVTPQGNLRIEVVRYVETSEYAGHLTPMIDSEYYVFGEIRRPKWLSWLHFLDESLEDRAEKVLNRAKQRAYQLNEQYAKANRFNYYLETTGEPPKALLKADHGAKSD